MNPTSSTPSSRQENADGRLPLRAGEEKRRIAPPLAGEEDRVSDQVGSDNMTKAVFLRSFPTALVLLLLLLASCSITYVPYSSNFPLREEAFFSRDSAFTGRIPSGWFLSSEDTLAPSYLAWVVKDDFSAALTVKELHLDNLAAKRVQKEGPELLARVSMSFQVKDLLSHEAEIQPRRFTMRNREYCGYEFTEGNIRKRVVVFSAKGRYYESMSSAMKGPPAPGDVTQMFSAQQAFLNSLTF